MAEFHDRPLSVAGHRLLGSNLVAGSLEGVWEQHFRPESQLCPGYHI